MRKATRRAVSAKKSARVPRTSAPETVDDYLAAAPKDARAALMKLRKIIQDAAPAATEAISYQIPTFKLHGPLVAFAAFKDHCGFYVMSPAVMEAHKDALKAYDTAKATIRFPADKPLPAALVRTLVKARIVENETASKASRGGKHRA